MLDNIINCYHLATKDEISKGKLWYLDARKICKRIAKETNTKLITACGVMAALSPNNTWEQNQIDCKKYLLDQNHRPATYGMMREKAESIIIEDNSTVNSICKILNGQKITRFFLNIYSRRFNVVTIDRHAISIYFGTHEHDFKYTPKRVAKIRADYKRAAQMIGIPAYQLQAITWVTWKRLIK